MPSNDFGNQEPGTESEIKFFCKVNFQIDFPMTKKTKITGENAHPFYKWAAGRFGTMGKPRWNFHKFLIGTNDRLVNWFSTMTSPRSKKIIQAIKSGYFIRDVNHNSLVASSWPFGAGYVSVAPKLKIKKGSKLKKSSNKGGI